MLGHAPLSTNSVSELQQQGSQSITGTFAATLSGVAVAASGSAAPPDSLRVTLDGVTVAFSGAVNKSQTATLTVTLDGVTVALAGATDAPEPVRPGVSFQQTPAGGMGWAWVGDKMVYGTREDVERAAKEHQEKPKAEEPPKRKRKKRGGRAVALGDATKPFDLTVPLIDWLGGAPDMRAYEAQAEVAALIARMREMEQDDEERLLAIVDERERQHVLAALDLVERML